MKKQLLLVLFCLPFMAQLVCAKDNKKTKLIEQAALLNEYSNDEKRVEVLKCCGNSSSSTIPSSRGKKGKKGRRGPRGLDGNPGLGEFFINSLMMAWIDADEYPPTSSFSPYFDYIRTELLAWFLSPSQEGTAFIGSAFNIPIDLDRTKPVTAVVHFFVTAQYPISGDQGQLELNIAYAPDQQIIGNVFPATDFSETINSDDFTIVAAMPLNSDNLRHQSVSIPLNPALMGDQNWAFMTVNRSEPAANEYQGSIYLSTISIQYSRLP